MPPEHLQVIAHRMASKTLPNKKERAKHRKSYKWSPVKRADTTKSIPGEDRPAEHSKAYDAAQDTEHFAISLIATGLRSMSPLPGFFICC
jgi:sterol 3beta-glucosyltransferase